MCSSITCPQGKYHRIIDGKTPDLRELIENDVIITEEDERIEFCCSNVKPRCSGPPQMDGDNVLTESWTGEDLSLEEKCRLSYGLSSERNEDGEFIDRYMNVSPDSTELYDSSENAPGDENDVCCETISNTCNENTFSRDNVQCSERRRLKQSPAPCPDDDCTEEHCCEDITGLCKGNTDLSNDFDCSQEGMSDRANPDPCPETGCTKEICCVNITGLCSGNTNEPDHVCPVGKINNGNSKNNCEGGTCESICCDLTTCHHSSITCPIDKVKKDSDSDITQEMINQNTIEEECCVFRSCDNDESYTQTCDAGQNVCKYSLCGASCDDTDCCSIDNSCPCTELISCPDGQRLNTLGFYDPNESDSNISEVCCIAENAYVLPELPLGFSDCSTGYVTLCEQEDFTAIREQLALELGGDVDVVIRDEDITAECSNAISVCGSRSTRVTCSTFDASRCNDGIRPDPGNIVCEGGVCSVTECCITPFTNMEGFRNYYLEENMKDLIEGVENEEYTIPISVTITPTEEDAVISQTSINEKLESGIEIDALQVMIRKINNEKRRNKDRQSNVYEIVTKGVALVIIISIVMFAIYKFKSKNPLEELLS